MRHFLIIFSLVLVACASIPPAHGQAPTVDVTVNATWGAPAITDTAGAASSYEYRCANAPLQTTSQTSFTWTGGLSAGTYECEVRPLNAEGPGPWSAATFAISLDFPPGPVQNFQLTFDCTFDGEGQPVCEQV